MLKLVFGPITGLVLTIFVSGHVVIYQDNYDVQRTSHKNSRQEAVSINGDVKYSLFLIGKMLTMHRRKHADLTYQVSKLHLHVFVRDYNVVYMLFLLYNVVS